MKYNFNRHGITSQNKQALQKKKKKKEARISLHAKKRRLHHEHLSTHKRLRFRNGTGT